MDPELLDYCAGLLDAHARTLAAAHPGAVVESAIPGWVGRSREALAGAAGPWGRAAAALADRVAGHAEALRAAALRSAEMDAGNARVLDLGGTP